MADLLPAGVRIVHEPERTVVVPERWYLRVPGGYNGTVDEVPLIGNRTEKQRDEMVDAILKARGLR